MLENMLGTTDVDQSDSILVASARVNLLDHRVVALAELLEEALLLVRIASGRRHQIRSHLAHVGHPAARDGKYAAPLADFLSRLHRAGQYDKKSAFGAEGLNHFSFLSVNSNCS